MDAKNIINGTYGCLWVDNELWVEVDAFEAIVNVDYEDVNIAGNQGTFKKQTGWNGTGSLTVKKVNSRITNKMSKGIKKGETPRMKLIGKLSDPDALGSERIALYDVTFDAFTLMKFEQKTLGSNDVSFAFSDYEPIDTIEE